MTVEYRDETPFTGDNHTPTELANAIRTKKNGKDVREPIAQLAGKLDSAIKGRNIGNVVATPTKVFANLSALQSAYPNGADGIFVTTDTGHKYFWQSGAWVDGGQYQAIADLDRTLTVSSAPANAKTVGDRFRSFAKRYSLTNFIDVSFGFAQNKTPSFVTAGQIPTRMYSWMFFKIDLTDEIHIKPSENFEISVILYNDSFTDYTKIENRGWIDSTEDVRFSNQTGNLSIAVRKKDDLKLSDSDLQRFREDSTIELLTTTPRNYLEIWEKTTFEERLSGSNLVVNFETAKSHFHTDYIPVSPGEKVLVSGIFGGLDVSKNIRGVAGFRSKNLNSFTGWIYNNEIAGSTSDELIAHLNQTITIPQGVNYVIVSSYFASGSFINTVSRSSAPLTFIVSKNLETARIKSLENYSASGIGVMSTTPVKFGMAKSYGIGDCLIFKTPLGKSLVIDAGESSNITSTSYQSVRRILNQFGITHIDFFQLTHWHTDHFGGIESLVSEGLIDNQTKIWLPQDLPESYMNYGESVGWVNKENINSVQSILNTLKSQGADISVPFENESHNIDGLKITFVNTNYDYVMSNYLTNSVMDPNMTSIASFVEFGKMKVICSGDLYWDTYLEFHPNAKLPKANIFKSGHHGGHGSRCDKAMTWFNPEVVISSLGVAYTHDVTDDRKNVWWSNTTDSIQNWCEDDLVPNYITGFNDSEIFIDITSDSWQLVNALKLANRKVEGIL